LVLKVGGESVQTWQEMRWLLLQRAVEQDQVDLEVINPQHEIAVRRLDVLAVRRSGWEGDALDRLGLTLYRPRLPPCWAGQCRTVPPPMPGCVPETKS
jgi:regulator of sigma E protease